METCWLKHKYTCVWALDDLILKLKKDLWTPNESLMTICKY